MRRIRFAFVTVIALTLVACSTSVAPVVQPSASTVQVVAVETVTRTPPVTSGPVDLPVATFELATQAPIQSVVVATETGVPATVAPSSPTSESATVSSARATSANNPRTYVSEDGDWVIKYPADLLHVEKLAGGETTLFISQDRSTFVAVDRFRGTSDAYGNTGEGVRNSSRDLLARIYGRPVKQALPVGGLAAPWRTGVDFTTDKGSKGQALYQMRSLGQNNFQFYGVVYGYKAANEARMLPLLRAARDSFTLKPTSPQPPATTFDMVFEGSIGQDNKLQMRLRRNGTNLSGSYFYERVKNKTGVRQDLRLEGTVESGGGVLLKEFNGDAQTGVFKGTLTPAEPGDKSPLKIAGAWSTADGSKTFPFTLVAQRWTLRDGVTLASKTKNEESATPKLTIETRFPVIEGSTNAAETAFNQQVDALVAQETSSFKTDATENARQSPPMANDTGSGIRIDYTITAASGRLVSVLFDVSIYMAGAAHPNQHFVTLTYDLAGNKRLTLADLFKPGVDYLPIVANRCIETLKQRGKTPEDVESGASAKPENYRNWNISPQGLEIAFDPYQVASYAEGPQRVVIPIEALKNIIDPAGPAAQLMK
jgi:hypothetical protein